MSLDDSTLSTVFHGADPFPSLDFTLLVIRVKLNILEHIVQKESHPISKAR